MTIHGGPAASYILCEVHGATYALPSDDIEQLDMVGPLTPVPNAPPWVDGVVSVRGQVIPAMSLRARFGFPRAAYDVRSRLIVVRSGGRKVGLLADSAREFAAIDAAQIEPPPEAMAGMSGQYLRGIAHLGERLVLVLDVAELLKLDAVPQLPAPAQVPAGTAVVGA